MPDTTTEIVRERLRRGDYKLIAGVVIVMLLCVIYARRNFSAAFPEASLDLRYSKDQITEKARQFLLERGLKPDGFRNLTLFDPDDDARLYLEREMGLEEANRLMRDRISIWRWRARWFRPPEKEEQIVYLSPTGQLVGFEHIIPEAKAGARLDKEEARRIAKEFLDRRTSAPHKLIEEQLQEKPNRFDYLFTWEQEGFAVKDATYRRSVLVQGDTAGRYSEFLHVPEKWQRDFAAMRSRNELYTQIAQAFYLLLLLASIGLLLHTIRRRLVRWRPLAFIVGAVGLLMIANQWNSLPFFVDAMPTSSTFPQSIALGLLQGLGAGVGVFFYLIVPAAAGEPIYRGLRPDGLSLVSSFTARGVRTREFFLATVVGYGFTAVHIAFIVAFYTLGQKVGVWSPQDVSYSDMLSTALPWLYPLTIAIFASVSEEFWFRLFAIPFLRRYLRLRWLAVVIPAFIWGFLHANYPQQPAFIRGIEVGVVGVAAGFLMLRFGILATLVWHYTVDAALIGLFLIQSGSLYFQVSGFIVSGAVMFPLAASLFFYWKNGGFERRAELLNASLATETEAETHLEAAREHERATLPSLRPRWPVKWLYVVAACGALVIALLHPQRFGDFVKTRLSRMEARQIAGSYMAVRQLKPDSWWCATQFLSNLDESDFEYLRRTQGIDKANEAVKRTTLTALWRTRYFRPMQKEEWQVYVDQNGKVVRVDRLLDEKAPGAQLSQADAQQLAVRYLKEEQGLPVASYRLVDASSEKRANRVDHAFVWEDPALTVGEAKARVEVHVVGDTISGYNRFLKLPEQWLREFERFRIQTILPTALAGGISLPLLFLIIRRLGKRRGHIYHWKLYLGSGALAMLFAGMSQFNQWPVLMAFYDTSEPLQNYVSQLVLGRLMFVLLIGFGGLTAALALDLLWQMALGLRPPSIPSLPRVAAICLLAGGVRTLLSILDMKIPGPRYSLPLWDLPGADTAFPAISVLARSFLGALFELCVIATLLFAFVFFVRPSRRVPLIGFCLVVFAIGRSDSLPQFGFQAFLLAAWIGVGLLVLRTCAADLVTFGAATWLLSALPPALNLLAQPAASFRWNGAAAIAVVVAAVVAAVWAFGKRLRLQEQKAPAEAAEPVS